MKQFVPIEDDLPRQMRSGRTRIVPYRPGLACHHQWRVVAEGDVTCAVQSARKNPATELPNQNRPR